MTRALGAGNDKMQWLPLLVSALELQHVVSIAAGFAHTVALTLDGDIYTWGSGRMGRLGHGSESDEVRDLTPRNRDLTPPKVDPPPPLPRARASWLNLNPSVMKLTCL